jgi:predicted AlkP superfamily pyrophosphatase or phosphodiesterase
MRAVSLSTWLAWFCLNLSPSSAEHVHADQVILVSVDGLRPDALSTLGEAGAPNFHRLKREGAVTGNARADNDLTVTLPNHTGMITGRRVAGPSGHAWTVNTDPFPGVNLHRNRGGYIASVFDVVHDHGLRTGLYASKSKFSLYDTSYDGRSGAPDTTGIDNSRDKIDDFVANESTAELMTAFVAAMVAKPFDFAMLHLRDPDTAGHATNWDLTSGSGYLRAVQHVDGLLGQLLDAIQQTESLKGHTWIVLTADHGGILGTIRHDVNDSPEDYTIPFMVWGPGVPAGANLYDLNATTRRNPGTSRIPYEEELQPIRNADAGNLVLSLMGLPAIPGSTVNARQDLKVR